MRGILLIVGLVLVFGSALDILSSDTQAEVHQVNFFLMAIGLGIIGTYIDLWRKGE